jgi:hypothetical protein
MINGGACAGTVNLDIHAEFFEGEVSFSTDRYARQDGVALGALPDLDFGLFLGLFVFVGEFGSGVADGAIKEPKR